MVTATTKRTRRKARDYKSDIKPIWCPGCGHHGVLTSLLQAFAYLDLDPEQVVLVSGIGCSSRIPAYLNTYGFHGVHGRALPLASGLKLARPDLTVLVASGDGDGLSIGGNHFIHACRRNVDLTFVIMDNEVYGMTKGQPSPTTPPDWDSRIAPGGSGISPFSPLALALAAAANFIARAFAGDPNETTRILVEAIRHPGFSFVQVLSPCVTFRPEERAWKQQYHHAEEDPTDDRGEAGQRILGDDRVTTGVLYVGRREPHVAPVGGDESQQARIEEELLL